MDIGGIASVIGTVIAALLGWRQWKRRIKVMIGSAIIGTSPEPTNALVITAANPGPRPITIHGAALQLPNRKQLVVVRRAPYDVELPHELKEGKNCQFFFPLQEIVRGLSEEGFSGKVTLRGVIRDGLGKEYKSRRFSGSVENWRQATTT